MGTIKIQILDKTEIMFRKAAMKKFGYRKGAISVAAQQAIQNWASANLEISIIRDPIEAISGLMKHIKKDSVKLQHEVGGIIGGKYSRRR